MKRDDIKPCIGCGRGVMHGNAPTFFVADISYQFADFGAIQREHGLEQMLGGNVALARVFSTERDLTKEVVRHAGLWVCLDCATQKPLWQLFEAAGEGAAAAEGEGA